MAATAMVATDMVVTVVAMAVDTVMAVATDTTARGRLRLSPATATAAMVVATDMAVATDTTARGLLMPSLRLRPRLSPDTVMAVATATGVSYHRIRRSEL